MEVGGSTQPLGQRLLIDLPESRRGDIEIHAPTPSAHASRLSSKAGRRSAHDELSQRAHVVSFIANGSLLL
eukprot:6975044-Prymnesium_polylepis.1